jgi:hypothetical protein
VENVTNMNIFPMKTLHEKLKYLLIVQVKQKVPPNPISPIHKKANRD